jgi:hypothetical protein
MKRMLLHIGTLALLLLPNAARADSAHKQEAVVRAAYAKVSDYNKAAYLQDMATTADWIAEGVALRFELRDFHSGPLSEIAGRRWSELVTPSNGSVISGVRRTLTQSGAPRQLSYAAEWSEAPWASFDDGRWTVGEVAALSSETFRDVSSYTSYEVTVTLEGRSRTYRAMAFFHDLYSDDSRAEIADNVANGGEITQMLYETLPSYRADRRAAQPSLPAEPAQPRTQRGFSVQSEAARPRLRVATEGQDPWVSRDYTEHEPDGGYHGINSTFTWGCSYKSDTEQQCYVYANAQGQESGNISTFGKSHTVAVATENGVQIGPTGTLLSCGGAAGVGVKSCFVFCGVGLSVSWNGVGATLTSSSDLLWSDKLGLGRSCQLQTKYPGHDPGCSTTTFQNADQDCSTPIMIDVDGDGYALTSAQDGVPFDLDSNGAPEQLSWTAAGEDDALLVLDRNGNGRIDDGRELFGNFTAQAESSNPNGFLALAELDRIANGGNEDGVVDANDNAFATLRLWRDANHDGLTAASELSPLGSNGVTRLHLAYKESRRVDEHGNAFRYRAKVDTTRQSDTARWAWDVFLVRQ